MDLRSLLTVLKPGRLMLRNLGSFAYPATISPDGMNSDAYLSPSDPRHSQHQYWLLNRTLKLEDGSVKERKKKTGNDHLKNLKELL